MRVQCLITCEMKLPSGAVREYPAGWDGEIPDDVAAQWIEAKAAEKVAVPGGFTPQQEQILAAAADKALAAVPASEPEPKGELTVEPDLDALSVSELRAMAIGRGVKGAQTMKRADLIKALATPRAA